MVMTSSSTYNLDAEKQRYAHELAEYTRRQWDMARRSLELSQSQKESNGSQNGTASPSSASSRSSQASGGAGASHGECSPRLEQSRMANDDAGLQSHDYATRSHRRGGDIGREGRAGIAAQ